MTNATRHRCTHGNGHPHTAGDGAPRRKKCAYCGGHLITETGIYGVFEWTGDSLYRLEGARRTFTTRRAADTYANANGDNLVSRWIMKPLVKKVPAPHPVDAWLTTFAEKVQAVAPCAYGASHCAHWWDGQPCCACGNDK
jgi:hypothetical protein